MISHLGNFSILTNKGIVVQTPSGLGGGETVADFYAFYGSNGHNGLGQTGVQFLENRFSNTGGKSFGLTFDDTAGGIQGVDTLLQIILCLPGIFFIWHV